MIVILCYLAAGLNTFDPVLNITWNPLLDSLQPENHAPQASQLAVPMIIFSLRLFDAKLARPKNTPSLSISVLLFSSIIRTFTILV